jgi:hypothetical protein
MKSKNKFTNNFSNNFKNNKYINIVIITLIIGFSIYLLYFNDKIYVQDSITNSLNEKDTNNEQDTNNDQDYLVENFDVGKYVDVCKNRNTQFYNLGGITQSNKNIDECEKLCSDASCHVFSLNGSTCTTYKGTLDTSTYIDTRDATTNPIGINCNSKVFPANNPYNTGTYNGIGYINKNYLQNNKNNLKYIDPYLEESANVLADLYSIENKRNQIKNLDPLSSSYDASYQNLSLDTITKDRLLFNKFDSLNRDIFDMDNSRNILYTDMYNDSDISNTILAPLPRDDAFMRDITKKYNMVNKSDNLDGILDAKSENFVVNNYRYLILAFIMVITIIILILYKSSNFINEKILIVYIIIISFLVLFITHQLKL